MTLNHWRWKSRAEGDGHDSEGFPEEQGDRHRPPSQERTQCKHRNPQGRQGRILSNSHPNADDEKQMGDFVFSNLINTLMLFINNKYVKQSSDINF
jgi:hypothetical protein